MARQVGTAWQQGGLNPVYALQVFGMRRAGNHAIISWLLRNAPEGASGGLFYNNCQAGTDPRTGYATFDCYDVDRRLIASKYREPQVRLPEAGQVPMVVVSYEDRMPNTPQKAAKGFGADDFDHIVLIYRSFMNWAASMLAKLRKNARLGPLDRLHQLSHAFGVYAQGLDQLARPDVTGICYDEWMALETYRGETLTRLGLAPHTLDRGAVQRFGGGSSFQARIKNPADLDTLSRADEMADDPEYLMLMWMAGHDLAFMERLVPHFPRDAERLIAMAETARFDMGLPETGGTK